MLGCFPAGTSATLTWRAHFQVCDPPSLTCPRLGGRDIDWVAQYGTHGSPLGVDARLPMLPRPRSIVEEVADKARAPVPTGTYGSMRLRPLPSNKDDAILQFMEQTIRTQRVQQVATNRVARALSRMDKTGEFLPFNTVLQDQDLIQDQIDELHELKEAYRKGRTWG